MEQIDESLYSRQLYAIGRDAMSKITQSSVCISGLSGLGVELAKCIILSGISKVTLHTPSDILTFRDLASNYYADETMVGKQFLSKITQELSALNNNVEVKCTNHLTKKLVESHSVMVFCDYNIHELLHWNKFCRSNGIKFIALQTYGLAGNLFCDFGDNHIVNDPDGMPVNTGRVKEFKNNNILTYEPHQLCTGDVIILSTDIYLQSTKTKEKKFTVKTTSATGFELHEYKDSMSPDELRIHAFRSKCIDLENRLIPDLQYTQIKIPVKIEFKSLEQSLNEPEYVMFDTMRFDSPQILNAFMIALSMWRINKRTQGYPRFTAQRTDFEEMYVYFNLELKHTKKNKGFDFNDDVRKIFDLLAFTSSGLVPGVDAIIGSMGAQEVIKAVSCKFTPNKQFLHLDALNTLPDNYLQTRNVPSDQWDPQNSRYDAQIAIFGRKYVEMMHEKNIFIVGSGAIGCEHIKNFCMMGIGLHSEKEGQKSGSITLTDMDHIENSNLSRQFLFRRSDIGQSKSLTAGKKAIQMNPKLNIIAQCNKVCPDTVNIYDNKFFNKLDVVANALDNVEARLYVDQRCVRYNVPLLESGTLGTKGSVQSIIPGLTESYGSVQDPPEQSIPVCTLKSFPYKYEHVVQHSKDLFEGYFNRIPSNIIKYMKNPLELKSLNPDDLETVANDMMITWTHCTNFKFCIEMAFIEWHKLFRDDIQQLIEKYPLNHIDEDGNQFWTGNKVFPKAFDFDPNDQLNQDFIISFSNIWADMLGLSVADRYKVTERHKYVDFLKGLPVPMNGKNKNNEKTSSDQRMEQIHHLLANISSNSDSVKGLNNLRIVEFEKDDDTNHHIDFITAASNIRALNYMIKGSDRLETKGIAGKIIPALATTTSIVSGIVSLEMYKVFYGQSDPTYNTLERYKYGSFNLATQSFGFSESMPAIKSMIGDKKYDLWTKDQLDPDLSIEDLLEMYHSEYTKQINDQTVDIGIDLGFIANDKGIICDDPVNATKMTLRELIESTLGDEDELIEDDYYLTLCLEEYECMDEESVSESEKPPISHLINCKIKL
jgi:ubiquitin-activating enzyme E1